MTTEEKNILKERYNDMKVIAKKIKSELKKAPIESVAHFELAGELSAITYELEKINRALKDTEYRASYLDRLLGFVFLGEGKGR